MNHREKHPVSTVRIETDTAHPRTVVPIYYYHTLERPFCPLPGCGCHARQQEIAALLEQIQAGGLTLRAATDFADGRTV